MRNFDRKPEKAMLCSYLLRLWYQIILDGCFFVVVVTEWRTTLERLTAAKTDTEFTEEKMGHGRELFFFCAMYLLRTVSQKDYKCDYRIYSPISRSRL